MRAARGQSSGGRPAAGAGLNPDLAAHARGLRPQRSPVGTTGHLGYQGPRAGDPRRAPPRTAELITAGNRSRRKPHSDLGHSTVVGRQPPVCLCTATLQVNVLNCRGQGRAPRDTTSDRAALAVIALGPQPAADRGRCRWAAPVCHEELPRLFACRASSRRSVWLRGHLAWLPRPHRSSCSGRRAGSDPPRAGPTAAKRWPVTYCGREGRHRLSVVRHGGAGRAVEACVRALRGVACARCATAAGTRPGCLPESAAEIP